jgi:hypothetical protein
MGSISTKIKTLGAVLVFLMLSLIVLTIYLNQKNIKDALVINIAGKERMLTQKISKNIFYLYQSNTTNFSELDNAIEEFVYGINSLKDGNDLRGLESAPTDKIAQQISKIIILWNSFNNNVQDFKRLLILKDTKNNEKFLKNKVSNIYSTNNNLLQEVDNLVTMYTIYSENKTKAIKYFQYAGALVLLLLIVYSLYQLKNIESHANIFLEYSKNLALNDENILIEPIELEAEVEIEEATNSLNCFIKKVNSAVNYSNEALEQSKQASIKLEEITDEFDEVLKELNNSATIVNSIERSEDIAIQSTEELTKSTKRLKNLKIELDKLLITCQAEI